MEIISLPSIIDVEASGFGAGSYPIEIGVVLGDGRTACSLIRPEPAWKRWEAGSEAVHGISRAGLLLHGRPAVDVADMFNDLLRGEVVYSDAWGHDSSWLGLLFDAVGRTQRFRVESLRCLLNEVQLRIWHSVKDDVERELALRRHRASTDALVLQQTYSRTRAGSQGAASVHVPQL